jgi:calcineurin-like phosphoesterase family protein
MNEDIIQKWNNKVKPEDTVCILGDMFFKQKDNRYVTQTLLRLNGEKILIVGNHDQFLNVLGNTYRYFKEVTSYKKIQDNGRQVILFHYPIEEWDGFYRGSYHLYGHVHNNTKNQLQLLPNRYNVGVDVNGFEPKTLDELIENKKINC